MIQIDEMSSEVLTDTEISNRVAAMIESTYPAGRELKIMRTYLANPQDAAAKAAFDAYNADVELIRADGVAARQKAILVRAAIEWEHASERLLTPAVVDPTTIDITGGDGLLVSVANPAIAQDSAERAEAQRVVDSIATEVQAVIDARTAFQAVDVSVPVLDNTVTTPPL